MAADDFVNVDLDHWDDMDPYAAELTDPVDILKQDIFHRLIETPGSNLDDPELGIGLEQRLSGVVDPNLAAHIDAALQKDPRIDVSTTTVSRVSDGVYAIHIVIEYDGEELGLDFTSDATGVRVGGA